MEQNALTKFFIPFLLMWCSHGASNVRAFGSRDQLRMFKRVTQERLWPPIWFEEFSGVPHDKIWSQDPAAGMMSRLRMVSPMMGCIYGVYLQWFLMLALESIGECDRLLPQDEPSDACEDCRCRVSRSIDKGRQVTRKLMRTLQYVHVFVILDDFTEDPFYQQLSRLGDFYTAQTPEIYSQILPGGLEFNKLLKTGAESLGEYMMSSCKPNYPLFNLAGIKNAYAADNHTEAAYLIYVTELDSYAGFIDNHLNTLRLTPW